MEALGAAAERDINSDHAQTEKFLKSWNHPIITIIIICISLAEITVGAAPETGVA